MSQVYDHITFISAGAGSGKTYRLTEELQAALVAKQASPAGVIGTTFTVKAASELKDRVRERLIKNGYPQLAEQMAQALIGTVHSVCERLLKRFAFELGLSPTLNVVSIEDTQTFFNQALDEVLSTQRVRDMNGIAERLGIENWQKHVKELADGARGNDLPAADLPAMGRASADALLTFFPAPEESDADAALLKTVKEALERIDLSVDTTQGAEKYYRYLRSAIYQLRRFPCPWAVWIGLSKKKTTKKTEPIAGKVRRAAAGYESHPRFHEDIRRYTENVYGIAADALTRFQAIKVERGLIDFTDMEQLTLRALDDETVKARLADELELLLVDEFQDTNPMQLALFMKLAALAERVIFVGDVKQAIYAFRGCDPDLVFETLRGVTQQGGTQDLLKTSWRSRPALVHYINAAFTEAFQAELRREEVTLRPERIEASNHPAVTLWTLPKGNKEARAIALAHAVAKLVSDGFEIVDPETDEVRAAQWGDIAILAATNDNVEEIARALRAARVPMKMTLKGLLAVPEVALARACLRRLNDSADTLATAEIISLADCEGPETWLAERLRYLQKDGNSYTWAEESHGIIGRLKRLREETATQSPVETVARVLNYVGVREAVAAWGPDAIKVAQRQRNLDAFLRLAVDYENHCQSQQQAATLTGFLFWIENPQSAELDLQPVVTTGNAVHVLTHHKAKGLEWSIVITTDFSYDWRGRIWDVQVESPEGELDLANPLTSRTIKFWPQIFGRRTTDIPILDAIMGSTEGRTTQEKNRSELRRLAYVGMTRARDALIIPLPAGNVPKDAWINAFHSDYLLPRKDSIKLPDGKQLPCATVKVEERSVLPDPVPFAPRWFPSRTPTELPTPETVRPSRAEPIEGTRIAEVIELGDRIPIHGDDMGVIGSALHAVIAAELVNPGRDNLTAHAILDSYGAGSYVIAADALEAARRFRGWAVKTFNPKRILTEYPISHRLANGQIAKGWIDVLLETSEGWVIIDHKSSPRPRTEWGQELIEYSGQLAAYREALEATGKPTMGCFIHFPVGGGLVGMQSPG